MIIDSICIKESPNKKGLGIFSTRVINIGTVIWFPCTECRVYDTNELHKLSKEGFEVLDEYGYNLNDDSLLMPCGNNFLLNHSCSPNVLDFGLDFGIAIRKILPNEEITIHYSTFQSEGEWRFSCECKNEDCLKIISSPFDDELIKNLTIKFTNSIKLALKQINVVDQPLHKFLVKESSLYKSFYYGNINIDSFDLLTEKYSVRINKWKNTDI